MARPFSFQNRIVRPPVVDQMRTEYADVLLFVNRLHFRQLRQPMQLGFGGLALHAADRDMHPNERSSDQPEQQHEAACPDAGEIVERAERDRQDEAAEPADQPDQPADGTDMAGIVDRDVLVDRGLAQAHEEAEHEHDDDEFG
jgi:hypothetical protein